MSDSLDNIITQRLDSDLQGIVDEIIDLQRSGTHVGLAEVITVAYKKGIESGCRLTAIAVDHIDELGKYVGGSE